LETLVNGFGCGLNVGDANTHHRGELAVRNLAIALTLVTLVGCGGADAPYKTAIRKHLKDNTSSGKWEEIAWTEHKAERSGFVTTRLKYRVLGPSPYVVEEHFSVSPEGRVDVRSMLQGPFATDDEKIEGIKSYIRMTDRAIEKATNEEDRLSNLKDREQLLSELKKIEG
jgi:hypothetical protein